MEDKEPQSTERKSLPDNSLVSIVTQVLNGAKYLEPCIQSVLSQGYPRVEHIFVDGVSTDGTVEILSGYQAKHPERIRFISEPDGGVGIAWNKGIRMAKGEIIGWLGSDDMSEPGAIQAVVEFFRANPGAYFVYGASNTINEKGELVGRRNTKDFNMRELIHDWCVVPTPSSFYRREVIDRVGYYNDMGNDYDFLVRVAEVFEIHRIDKILSNFRVHGESQTGAKKTHRIWLRADCQVSRRHGGGIFSGYCRRYYTFVIVEGLRPILGFTYPFLKRVLSWTSSSLLKRKV